MATTGSVDVNLTPYGNMINNSSSLGANITSGVADQGSLIGLAIGLAIAIVLLFGVVFLMFGKIMQILKTTKALKSA